MKSRTGQEVKLFVVSPTGKRTEMTSEAENPGGIKNNLLRVPAKNRLKALGLVFKIMVKKLFNKTYNERHEFMDLVYDIKHIEIEFEGKVLELPFGGDLWFMLYYQVFVKNQYDLNESNTKGKIFVDAGANLGAFSIFAACMGARKVYAFEPVKGTFEALRTNIQACGLEHIIIPVNKGLGRDNFTTAIKSDYSGDGGAAIIGGGTRDNQHKNLQQIEVITLDSFLNGEKVDLIKADVEGYEASVFLGASKTIAAYSPILDFSAYHRPTDRFTLPNVISNIKSGYICNLNTFYEEVLYCSVKEARK
jgi:FkbM family methyltransferase